MGIPLVYRGLFSRRVVAKATPQRDDLYSAAKCYSLDCHYSLQIYRLPYLQLALSWPLRPRLVSVVYLYTDRKL